MKIEPASSFRPLDGWYGFPVTPLGVRGLARSSASGAGSEPPRSTAFTQGDSPKKSNGVN
jgi:hypothetical protein